MIIEENNQSICFKYKTMMMFVMRHHQDIVKKKCFLSGTWNHNISSQLKSASELGLSNIYDHGR